VRYRLAERVERFSEDGGAERVQRLREQALPRARDRAESFEHGPHLARLLDRHLARAGVVRAAVAEERAFGHLYGERVDL
jgi:hypothetical protein